MSDASSEAPLTGLCVTKRSQLCCFMADASEYGGKIDRLCRPLQNKKERISFYEL